MNSLKRKDDSDNDIIYLESKPPTKKVQLPTENTIKAFKEAQRVAEKRKNEFKEHYRFKRILIKCYIKKKCINFKL